MKLTPGVRAAAQWLGGILSVAATTAVLYRSHTAATTAGMVFLVLVVWTATQAGVWLSLFVALLCALLFDYYFLPPIRTLTLAGVQEWVSMLSFAASSLVAGRVAERARRQAQQAEQRREDVERLYTLSLEMMPYEDASGLVDALPRMIERIFSLGAVVVYLRDRRRLFASTRDLPMSIEASLAALAEGHGAAHELPGGITAMPLMMGERQIGALGWRPPSLTREVATAMTAQVAIAVTRALAMEAWARLEAAREGERLRTALIDSVTHELRTPLTTIRGAASMLRESEGLDEDSRRDLAALVDEESERLDSLIGEAVEMAEIDANVVEVHAVPEHPRTLLDHAVQRSNVALAPHHVAILVEEPDTPAWFDPQLLGRVLRHLLENAARYCPPGSRIVLRSWRRGDRLEFAVEDNGPGIDPADLPLIFEKFYRGATSAAKGKGTGMGLAIVRAILAAHEGAIEVKSNPGEGTAFRFWIPLVEKEAPAAG